MNLTGNPNNGYLFVLGGQGVTPFIEIPTSRSGLGVAQTPLAGGGNTNTTGSSTLPSSVLDRINPATTQQ
jgi:hypothetical protein